MKRDSLDIYDVRPEDMVSYLRHYGMHFNRKLCEFAISKMTRKVSNNKQEPIVPLTKSQIDNILSTSGVTLQNNQLYDYVYVANMCKADYLGSSINDDAHMALYIKDVIDDDDGYDGLVFNRWYADMCRKGIAIDWEEML